MFVKFPHNISLNLCAYEYSPDLSLLTNYIGQYFYKTHLATLHWVRDTSAGGWYDEPGRVGIPAMQVVIGEALSMIVLVLLIEMTIFMRVLFMTKV